MLILSKEEWAYDQPYKNKVKVRADAKFSLR